MSDPDQESARGGPGAGLDKSLQRRIERRVESVTSRKGAAYQGAFEAVMALLIAMGLGYWADQKLGSAPIGMLAGVVFGFAAFVLRLMRLRRLIESSADEEGTSGGDGSDGS